MQGGNLVYVLLECRGAFSQVPATSVQSVATQGAACWHTHPGRNMLAGSHAVLSG